MKISLTKVFIAAMFIMGFLSRTSAQTVIWPTTDTMTIKASQFADSSLVFWERGTTVAPQGFAGWTTRGVSCDLAPAQKDSAIWRWSNTGKSLGTSGSARSAINSFSMANGSVIFDSDYLTGSSKAPADYPNVHSGDLISPIIDATGAGEVTVQFYHYYYAYYEDILLSWSEDGGTTWKDSVAVLPHSLYNQTLNGTSGTGTTTTAVGTFVESIPGDVMSIKLPGSVGTNKLRLKFTFYGDGYFWMLDDVRVVTYKNNMRANQDWFALAPNFVTPMNQVEPISFLTDISNQGNVAQPNAKATVTVTKRSDGSTVHTGTYNYGTLAPNAIGENALIPGAFTPSSTVKDIYTGIYRATSDSTDEYRRNDTTRFVFATSDSVFQKETGGNLSSQPADSFWGGSTTGHSWKIGNYFFVPKGGSSTATKITARVGNASALVGTTLQAVLYEWNQSPTDTFFAKAANLTPIAGGEVTVPTGTANFAYLDFKLEPFQGTNKNIYLKNNTAYIAMLEFVTTAPASATNGVMTITFDTRYDYGAMKLATRQAGKPRFASFYGGHVNWGNDFRADWFGSNYVPVVRLTVLPFRVNTTDILSDKNTLDVSPNPVTDNSVSLNISLEKQTDMVVRILSVDGKMLAEQNYDGFQKDQVRISMNGYPTGTYIAQILTAEGVLSRRFVIAK